MKLPSPEESKVFFPGIRQCIVKILLLLVAAILFAHTTPSESKRRLPESARDVYELLEQFRGSEAATLKSFRLLDRVFTEQCEITSDDEEGAHTSVIARQPREIACDNVLNPAD